MTDDTIPRSPEDDYSPEIVEQRQQFIEAKTGASLDHTKQFSFDPHEMESNIENFWGVAQIPIGVAGPLLINGGTHKESSMCLATVEGTMLASYNRGMKVIRECGGVLTTVSEEPCNVHLFSFSVMPGRPEISSSGSKTISKQSRQKPKPHRGQAARH